MTLLLANEQVSFRLVDLLKDAELDILTINDLGKDDQRFPDEDVLTLAHLPGRAVITFDRRDYSKLHQQGIAHSGIILCKHNMPINLLAHEIMVLAQSGEDISNKVVRIIQNSDDQS
jgi:predicted nuclease of predicted toxin-antitoxin system